MIKSEHGPKLLFEGMTSADWMKVSRNVVEHNGHPFANTIAMLKGKQMDDAKKSPSLAALTLQRQSLAWSAFVRPM